ncbi:twin-arginine translocase TatA/TatE family subunit [Patescibacteria group bacterium]|nr:twin-arginine translocase TatA/TatE family subunit [Patescibacteria group bacterium]MBU1448493.1 twin-arginine translocase TatA/TatE family subunit [Patescibacteria group bacterium]MBU2613727.1 twin-arginine translocase TatA/TatE family subunit [Patescibacteria group bacterium]
MFGLGAREIVILAAILVLLFGAKKIPELARSIGEAVRHIRGVFFGSGKEGRQQIGQFQSL